MQKKPLPMLVFYKLCALLGTLIIVVDVSYAWHRIQSFEHSVITIFESTVTSQMELNGLQQELAHIEKVLNLAQVNKTDNTEVEGIEYSPYEIERLKNDQGNIKLYIQEKQLDLLSSNGQKKYIMNEIRVLFLASLVFLVVGTLMAALGYLAWYFKIELFADRRSTPR